MAVVVPTGYAQVTYNWVNLTGDSNYSTVLGCQHTDAGANEIADTFREAWSAHLQSEQDASIRLTEIVVKKGPSTGPTPGLQVEFPVNEDGGNPGSLCPPNCAMLVRKLSNFGGKANRGRNYWPGFTFDGQVDELGQIDPTVITSMQGQFTSFFGALGSGNGATTALCPAVILHDESSPATAPVLVSAVQVDGMIASQRKRIRR